jgi:hypothetical protein
LDDQVSHLTGQARERREREEREEREEQLQLAKEYVSNKKKKLHHLLPPLKSQKNFKAPSQNLIILRQNQQ